MARGYGWQAWARNYLTKSGGQYTTFSGAMDFGVVRSANGSAAAPSHSFTADTDLGLYRIGADQLGVSVGGALDFSFTAGSFNVVSGSHLDLADSSEARFGDDDDIAVKWDATKLAVTQAATNSAIHLGVSGAGIDLNLFGDTAGADLTWDQSAAALIRSGAAVDLRTQAGTGTGVVSEVVGPDLTHGVKTTVYEATVSPAAIETALFTIPAMSVVDSVQANVQTALTGGGTTVTASIGITGDVDLYGTMGTAGVQADLLATNSKLDCIGTRGAGQGAGIGLFVAGTQALKLIGAATGGTAAGDTALTVGSVKVRVVYRTMMQMVNA